MGSPTLQATIRGGPYDHEDRHQRFGRIGRNFFRAAKERGADFDFVAANDLLSIDLMAHLLKYDTILGTYKGESTWSTEASRSTATRSRSWPSATRRRSVGRARRRRGGGVDGLFSDRDKAAQHLDAGAPLVIISAPGRAPTPRSWSA
jgi:glyceraldehyde 3-phosphate dehydrogenase